MRLILTLCVILISSVSFAKINVYVSILPQKYFAQSIGQDRINIKVMVMPGASPATYEPKPKQMVALSKTDIYFAIGSPFEKLWLSRFRSLNKELNIVHTDKGIKKRIIENHVHHEDEDEEEIHDEHQTEEEVHYEHQTKDPHIWLDPILVIKQAKHIAKALCEADPDGCSFYNANLASFTKKTLDLDNQLKQITSSAKGRYFMVFHPSWGYFANRYDLHQIPVELEGKEPKPSDLKEFVELTRRLKLKTIFIQPQFSRKAAVLIARETGANVVAVDPLSENWRANLIYAAELITGSF